MRHGLFRAGHLVDVRPRGIEKPQVLSGEVQPAERALDEVPVVGGWAADRRDVVRGQRDVLVDHGGPGDGRREGQEVIGGDLVVKRLQQVRHDPAAGERVQRGRPAHLGEHRGQVRDQPVLGAHVAQPGKRAGALDGTRRAGPIRHGGGHGVHGRTRFCARPPDAPRTVPGRAAPQAGEAGEAGRRERPEAGRPRRIRDERAGASRGSHPRRGPGQRHGHDVLDPRPGVISAETPGGRLARTGISRSRRSRKKSPHMRVSRPTVVRGLPLWGIHRKIRRQRDLVVPPAQKYASECCPLGTWARAV